jgi:hypothetical protein
MSAVPTVARWWGSRSEPQRLDLYTRWSLYAFIALTPLLTTLGLGSAATTNSPALLGAYVLGPSWIGWALLVVGGTLTFVAAVLLVCAGRRPLAPSMYRVPSGAGLHNGPPHLRLPPRGGRRLQTGNSALYPAPRQGRASIPRLTGKPPLW